jgi:hypothetical protein
MIVKATDSDKRLTVAAVHPKDAGPVLEIHETSAGRLSHLVIKLAFVARLRRRAATKSRNARVLNGSRPVSIPQSDPHILMVESTEHGPPFDAPVALNGPSNGCILP